MGIKQKQHIESQKKAAEERLAARLELLKGQGLGDDVIRRETMVRKFNAEIRKAKQRLAAAAAAEKLTADKARIKTEKAAAPKDSGKKSAPKPEGPAPVKKPKKAKPSAE
jgi:hypothetical protein